MFKALLMMIAMSVFAFAGGDGVGGLPATAGPTAAGDGIQSGSTWSQGGHTVTVTYKGLTTGGQRVTVKEGANSSSTDGGTPTSNGNGCEEFPSVTVDGERYRGKKGKVERWKPNAKGTGGRWETMRKQRVSVSFTPNVYV
jgi:hypothetical protein